MTDRKTLHPIEALKAVVDETASHIQDFTKSPTDFIRNRKLNAKTTLELILNMQGNSLNAELLNAFPDADERMTASAFEQAKGKLTSKAFEHIFHQFNNAIPVNNLLDGKYRTFAIDGTDFTTPYNPKSNRIVKPNQEEKLICMTHANILYDIENKIYQDIVIQPRLKIDERAAAIEMIKRLDDSSPNIVIMDRGYESFNLVETCNRTNNLFYVIRAKVGDGGIKEIKELPEEDCDVDISTTITTSNRYYVQNKNDNPYLHMINAPKKSHKESFSKKTKYSTWDFERLCDIRFRVVKFRIGDENNGTWEVLVTNLNRFEFPIERMKEMYHKRWDIETSFRALKYALGGINFHSKKDEFIDMEIFAHLTMFNVVSQSISQVEIIHKKLYAVDFKMACHIVRQYFHRTNQKALNGIFNEIKRYINPVRPGRADKRKVKFKPPVWFAYRVA